MLRCSVRLTLVGAVALVAGVAAQQPEFPITAQWLAAQWLATPDAPREQRDEAVKELLVKPAEGFDWLAKAREAAAPEPPRRKAIDALITATVIDYVRRQRQSGITFAGQYEPLRRLQPFVGETLFGLLLDTPPWFPHTHRVRLVRPLRDLHAQAPSEERLAQVAKLADSSVEPEELRRALACMLWQWGDRTLAQQRVDALRREAADGAVEDRLRNLLDLAALQYELLDYRAAAATHRSVQALADASKVDLKPIDFYASACAHALVGDVERGIAALQRCATLQGAADVDPSLKQPRSLWENDPEIEPLRRDPRYAAIFARAFPPAPR